MMMYKQLLNSILVFTVLFCFNAEAAKKNNSKKKRIAKRVKLYKKLLSKNVKHLAELKTELSEKTNHFNKAEIQRKIDAIKAADKRYKAYIAKHGGKKK